jgi:hypothetical protein
MKKTADDIYRLDLQNPAVPLACPRCGKSYIVIQWLPGGQWGIAHRCADGVKPVEMRFNDRGEAVAAWNRYCRGGDHEEQMP